MTSFLTFRIINTRIFLYFQKVVTLKLWQNTQFTTAILFCFTVIALRCECKVIVRDNERIRLLELPRTLSVYNFILIHLTHGYTFIFLNCKQFSRLMGALWWISLWSEFLHYESLARERVLSHFLNIYSL